MNALAEAGAGLALVTSLTMLVAWRVGTVSFLLAAQCVSVAVSAVLLHQPLMALPPLLFAGGLLTGGPLGVGVWSAGWETAAPRPPAGHSVGVVATGTILAVLCLSHRGLGLPLAIVLLAILFAAARVRTPVQVLALVAMQNGLVLAGSLVAEQGVFSTVFLPVACFALPLPLAAHGLLPAQTRRPASLAAWPGWADLMVSVAMFAATLIVPLDGIAAVFAPLLGFDAVVRSFVRRKTAGLASSGRIVALLQAGFIVLAVCASNLIVGWLVTVGAMSAVLLPRLRSLRPRRVEAAGVAAGSRPAWPALARRWDAAVLAFAGAAIALFGLLMSASQNSILGYFSLFVGFAAIAAVVPDLAVVLVILLLRLANQTPWPPGAGALGSGIALVILLACAFRVSDPRWPRSAALLVLGQCSVAWLAICAGQEDGRFAALVLLVLLILTRSAARVVGKGAYKLAMAGLGGVPPLGVFPGLVLVLMAVGGSEPWILLPLAVALVALLLASLPRSPLQFPLQATIPPLGWVPLAIALLVGYCAPRGLVHWWHVLTAGRS